MKLDESKLHSSARGYLCCGCDKPIDETDGVFIYHRTDSENPAWQGYVSHARLFCVTELFVRYIRRYSDLNSLEAAIALDKAVRDMRENTR